MKVKSLETFLDDYIWLPDDFKNKLMESKDDLLTVCDGSASAEAIWDILKTKCLNSWFIEEKDKYNLDEVIPLIKNDIILSVYCSYNYAQKPGKSIRDFVNEVLSEDPEFRDSEFVELLIKKPNLKSDLGEKWSKKRKGVLDAIGKAVPFVIDPRDVYIPTQELYDHTRQFSDYYLKDKKNRKEHRFFYFNASMFYYFHTSRNRLPFTFVNDHGMYIKNIYNEIREVLQLLESVYQGKEDPIEKASEAFILDNLLSISNLDFIGTHYMEKYTNLSTSMHNYSSNQSHAALYFYQFLFPLPYELCISEIKKYDKVINSYFGNIGNWNSLKNYILKYLFIHSCLIPVMQTVYSNLLLLNETKVSKNESQKLYESISLNLRKYILDNNILCRYYDLPNVLLKSERISNYQKYLHRLQNNSPNEGNKGRDYQEQLEFNLAHYCYFVRNNSFIEKCKLYNSMDSSCLNKWNPKYCQPFEKFMDTRIKEIELEFDLVCGKSFPETDLYLDFIKRSKNRKVYPNMKKSNKKKD